MNITLKIMDIAAISPLLILIFTAFIVILIESFSDKLSHKYSLLVTLIGFAAALFAVISAPTSSSPLLTPWLRFDSMTFIFTVFFLTVGFCTALLSSSFFQFYKTTVGEYYFLLISSVFGLILIGSSADFLTLFLGLETLSISLYVMCGYTKKWSISREGAMKYFFMGSLATAFLLYGIALIYGAVGVTRFDVLMSSFDKLTNPSDITLFYFGIALVTLGLAFKAAIVPFHVWAPDVYDGSPTPVTAFMAVGTKAGAFAAFARLFLEALPQFDPQWSHAMAWLAFPTLIYANITAIRQVQLRRFFAYSGISHSGFLLMALAAGVKESFVAIEFYLIVYALSTLGAFAVMALLDRKKEGVLISDLYGLFGRDPLLASILALCLLTLAGIPPTAGFLAKFYLFKLAFQAGYYALVIVALLTTILGVFYYTRIIAVMMSKKAEEGVVPTFSWPAAVVGAFTCAGILLLSVYPTVLLSYLTLANK
jgi:NADH-quinone oxidoreductase subunit N